MQKHTHTSHSVSSHKAKSTVEQQLTMVTIVLFFRELFSPSQKYQLLVYNADAIFHDKEYRNAACKYNMALQQKKVISKTSKVRPSSTGGTTSALQPQVSSSRPSHYITDTHPLKDLT